MIRLPLLTCIACLVSLTAWGQQRIPANQNNYGVGSKGIIYDNELTFHFALSTPRNIFLGVRSGKLITYDKMKYWSASFGNIRHSRERRENPDAVSSFTNRVSRAYTYGKINQLYALRVGFGTRKYLSEKARQRGVAVGYSYEFGPSLGLLKPYYLEFRTSDGPIREARYTGDNAAEFLDVDPRGNPLDKIFGASAWTVGIDEIAFRPGIHAKAAAHFGFGAYDEMAKSLEAGLMVDFFLGNTDLMLASDLTPGVTNSPLFLSLFLKVQFGKRW